MGSWTKSKIVATVALSREVYSDLLKISRVSGRSASSIVSEATGERLEELKQDYPEYVYINVEGQIRKRLKSQSK